MESMGEGVAPVGVAGRQGDAVGAGRGEGVGGVPLGRGGAVAEVPLPGGGVAGDRALEMDRGASPGFVAIGGVSEEHVREGDK